MRAHQPTAKSKSEADGRVRLFIKSRLWWLEGFPSRDGWTAMPLDGSRPAETFALDRDHIRRAVHAVGKLERDFPRALPRVVGDAGRWAGAAREVLALASSWVHEGAAPPRDLFGSGLHGRVARELAAALAREDPALAPLVGALSWVLAVRAAEAPGHLRWLARNRGSIGGALERAGVVAAVRLVHLGAELGRLVEPLAALAGHPRLREVPISAARARLVAEAIRAAQGVVVGMPGEPMASTLPGEIDAWIDWLGGVDRGTRRRFLALLAASDLSGLVEEWSAWWEGVTPLVARAALLQRRRDPTVTPSALQRLRRSIEEAIRLRPVSVAPARLGRSLRALAAPAAEPCFGPARVALGRLPAGVRAALLASWGEGGDIGVERLVGWIEAFAGYLAATGASEAALRPFVAVERDGTQHAGWFDFLLDRGRASPRDRAPRFFAALTALHRARPEAVEPESVSRLEQLVCLFERLDPVRVAGLTAALFDGGLSPSWIDDRVARAALALSSGEAGLFAELVRVLGERYGEEGLAIDRLAEALVSAFSGDLAALCRLLLGEDRGEVVACAEVLAALSSMGGGEVAPVAPGPAAWIEEFPALLRPALEQLALATPDAEVIARRLVGAVWRSPASLEEELRVVEVRLRDSAAGRARDSAAGRARDDAAGRARLEARRATLARRLETSLPPGARDLRRLDEKLRRRAALELVRALSTAASARLGAAAARYFGLGEAPAWLAEPRHIGLLPALASLPAGERALARELVRGRSGPRPWDLRQHPANRRFLRGLVDRGVDPGPWLDGGAVERDSPVGRLCLVLEDDPLEIFHMGGHFRTCLSPGAVNFFSVVANAADVNKRVLYARSEAGVVLGRRLLGLTSDGTLLAFYAYCHDPRAGFDEMSARFARELARRMGTRVVGHGHIDCLVSRRWYDDGPVDITGQLAFLADDSPFRRKLAAAAPEELPALLAAELDADASPAHLAPMIAALPELDQRPGLAVGLLPLIREEPDLPTESILRLASLLVAAGADAVAAEYFAEALERGVERRFRLHGWVGMEGIQLLCRIAPSRGLRALRATRPTWGRRGVDDRDAERLMASADALERLRRPAQALAMVRRAARSSGPSEAVAAARKKLAELV